MFGFVENWIIVLLYSYCQYYNKTSAYYYAEGPININVRTALIWAIYRNIRKNMQNHRYLMLTAYPMDNMRSH